MFLLLNKDGRINDASNIRLPGALPDGFSIVEVLGDAETFSWPNGHPSRCIYQGDQVLANPAFKPLPDPAVLAALAASDAKMLRALEEGDPTRIAERKAEREALRAKLPK